MERVIKFRAWNRELKQMFWFDVMWGNHYGMGGGYIGMVPWGKSRDTESSYNGNQIAVDPDDCELMQFTGLRDKNGKEIYEGDIVKCYTKDFKYPHTGKVEMESSQWSVNVGADLNWKDDSDHYTPFYFNEDFEVLGNIYENPEL